MFWAKHSENSRNGTAIETNAEMCSLGFVRVFLYVPYLIAQLSGSKFSPNGNFVANILTVWPLAYLQELLIETSEQELIPWPSMVGVVFVPKCRGVIIALARPGHGDQSEA